MGKTILARLPEVRGKYRENADLSKVNWFNVGGVAEILFRPADVDDLVHFLKNKPDDIPHIVIGVGSNLLVRDGGIKGVVVRLGRGFSGINVKDEVISVSCGILSKNAAVYSREAGLSGLEFLVGIPGTIGGALAMNAGAYGSDISDIFVEATAVDPQGNIHKLKTEDMGFSYRHNAIDPSWIFVEAVFRGQKDDPAKIAARMDKIMREREETQPIRNRTSGSTFTNPAGKKAWQLIAAAGCRGLEIGGAKVSEKHCNFLINTGDATAKDLEDIGEEVRRRVKENSGMDLQWEIKIVGVILTKNKGIKCI